MKRFAPSLLILIIASFLISCGGQFASSDKCTGPDCNNDTKQVDPLDQDKDKDPITPDPDDKTDQTQDNSWADDALEAVITSGPFKNQKVVDYDSETDHLIISMPVPMVSGLAAIQMDVPELPGARVELKPVEETTSSGQSIIKKYLLVIRLPVDYVTDKIDSLPPSELPGGQTLPGWPDGEAPATHLSLVEMEGIDLHLYFNKNALGVFLELPAIVDQNPLDLSLSYPIYNEQQTKMVGHYAFIIPSKKQKGGLFLATQIPENVAKALKGE